MYGPILLMAGFFGCVVLLMVSITPVIWSGIDPGEATTASRIADVFDELQMTQWEPNEYEVTNDSTTGGHDFWDDYCVEFDAAGGSEHPLRMALVRDDWLYSRDGEDYWACWQYYGWLGQEIAIEYISLDEIRYAYDDDKNYSRMTLVLRFTFEIFFYNDTQYFPDILEYNTYSVSVGVGLNDSMDSLSPWSMLGKIMSFRMPGTNFVTNVLIAIPIYTALLYIAFAIIRSCIPLLGG